MAQEELSGFLITAAIAGDITRANDLLDAGADVNANRNGSTALMWASNGGHIDIVKLLLDRGSDPNLKDEYSSAALIEASRFGFTEIVKLLLDHGADPNIRDNDGGGALIWAASNGHSDTIRLLIKHGADPDLADSDGWTALMEAALNGYPDTMAMLIQYNADPGIRNKGGMTAIDVLKKHHPKIHSKWTRQIREKTLKLEDSVNNSECIPDFSI